VVDFSFNSLTGHIPSSFGNLSSLQQLQLSVNKLSGPVPPELARCVSLTNLELDNNQLTRSLPSACCTSGPTS
jgi:Leucine-rich repeat (LRR) protein